MLMAFLFHSFSFLHYDFSHLASLASLLAASATDPFQQLKVLSGKVNTGVKIVGVSVFVVAVSVAGVMRMVAFGSERRIAISNMALTAAVIGLIIMALGLGMQSFVCNALGGCK